MARGSITPVRDAAGKLVGYRLRYDLDPDPGTGERRQRRETVYGSKKQAEARLAQRLEEVRTGRYVAEAGLTVGEYLVNRWLPHYRRLVTKPSTYWTRESHVRLHLVPRLGAVKLAELRVLQVQGCYDALSATLKPSTVGAIHSTLRLALKQAERWELVTRNVATRVDPPRVGPASAGRAWTADEAARFTAAVRDRDDGPLFVVMLLAQLRRGEALVLRWADVDLDAATITVNQGLTLDDAKQRTVDTPKTPGSQRTIWLPPLGVELLRVQQARQAQRRRALGDRWHPDEVVFDRGDGRRWSERGMWLRFKAACRVAGVPALRPHDLRHTGMTHLSPTDVIAAQRRAGHSSLAMTLRYLHPELDRQRAGALALERVLLGAAAGVRATTVPPGDERDAKPA